MQDRNLNLSMRFACGIANTTVRLSKYWRAFHPANLCAAAVIVYIAAVILAPVISLASVDESIRLQLAPKLVEAGCNTKHPSRNATLLNPFEFFIHTGYWLADYRIPEEMLSEKNGHCAALLASSAVAINKNFRVAIIGKYRKVIGNFVFYTNENFTGSMVLDCYTQTAPCGTSLSDQ